MDYYQKKIYLARVDRNDQLIGPVERWRAHKEGILHRGFTVILAYKNQLILQHRKHPAFDKYYDLSFSSHPVYLVDDRLQDNLSAVYDSLRREWNLERTGLKSEIKFLDKFYYRAKDPKSIYIEHEIDYLYLIELDKLPKSNEDFAYGYSLIEKNKILDSSFLILHSLCPWVKKIIESKFFLRQ